MANCYLSVFLKGEEYGAAESPLKMEGRRMNVVVAPKKSKRNNAQAMRSVKMHECPGKINGTEPIIWILFLIFAIRFEERIDLLNSKDTCNAEDENTPSAKKRFKRTGSGKIAFSGENFLHDAPQEKPLRLRDSTLVSPAMRRVKRLLAIG